MTQIKNYLPTKEQVQAVQSTVDEINSKIVTPTYQVKTVTPSNVQQTVQADSGYTALSGIVVNPIAALMPENLEDYIMRNDRMKNFSISVSGEIPSAACYGQTHLEAVYGDLSGAIGNTAFQGCTSLQNIDARNVTSMGTSVFERCARLQLIDCTSCTTPPTIQHTTFLDTNNSFRVVVATNTEKALFQAATNWSARASQIYTVAEIEAIVGMTYDEYYLQIFGHARND